MPKQKSKHPKTAHAKDSPRDTPRKWLYLAAIPLVAAAIGAPHLWGWLLQDPSSNTTTVVNVHGSNHDTIVNSKNAKLGIATTNRSISNPTEQEPANPEPTIIAHTLKTNPQATVVTVTGERHRIIVNSPGATIGGFEELYNEIERLRKFNNDYSKKLESESTKQADTPVEFIDPQEALNLIQNAISFNTKFSNTIPGDASILNLRIARVYLSLGFPQKALELIPTQESLHTYDVLAEKRLLQERYEILAGAHSTLGNWETAIDYWKRVDPGSFFSDIQLANIYNANKQFAEASKTLIGSVNQSATPAELSNIARKRLDGIAAGSRSKSNFAAAFSTSMLMIGDPSIALEWLDLSLAHIESVDPVTWRDTESYARILVLMAKCNYALANNSEFGTTGPRVRESIRLFSECIDVYEFLIQNGISDPFIIMNYTSACSELLDTNLRNHDFIGAQDNAKSIAIFMREQGLFDDALLPKTDLNPASDIVIYNFCRRLFAEDFDLENNRLKIDIEPNYLIDIIHACTLSAYKTGRLDMFSNVKTYLQQIQVRPDRKHEFENLVDWLNKAIELTQAST